MKILEIGGSVRDAMLGMVSKDKDFVVVPSVLQHDIESAWTGMLNYLRKAGYEIFLETKSCYTVRARFPANHEHAGPTSDFVLPKKEMGYYPNTSTPILDPGTIEDDVWRRDFTVNTLYIEKGITIDLTGQGLADLKLRLIDTPLDPAQTFSDDPLRVFRALRFAITKKFNLADRVVDALHQDFDFSTVSMERVREELYKCFKTNTSHTLKLLYTFPKIQDYAFKQTKLWLKPTLEC